MASIHPMQKGRVLEEAGRELGKERVPNSLQADKFPHSGALMRNIQSQIGVLFQWAQYNEGQYCP